jgi:hypothetical protein
LPAELSWMAHRNECNVTIPKEIRGMKARTVIPAVALLFIVIGCAQLARRPPRNVFVGTVERVDDREGEHYSPIRGHQPLTCIHLRLARNPRALTEEHLSVLVLGLYYPEIYGQAGDSVSFGHVGNLPMSGELWFEELFDYTILPKKSAGQAAAKKSG